jgi:hypothetical protein
MKMETSTSTFDESLNEDEKNELEGNTETFKNNNGKFFFINIIEQ